MSQHRTIFSNRLSTACLLAIVPLLFAASCTDENATTGGVKWTFTIKVTAADGVCAGEENDPASTTTITIFDKPSVVTARGFQGSFNNALTGHWNGDTLTLNGSYTEGSGTTTTTFVLTRDPNNPNMLTGTETWSWSGNSGDCPNGSATVTAVKQ